MVSRGRISNNMVYINQNYIDHDSVSAVWERLLLNNDYCVS